MVRLAYHPASYLRQGVAADDAIAHMARVGWDGFEWSSAALIDHFGSAEACRDHLNDLGISLCGIYHSCGFETAEQIDDWIERAAVALEFGRTAGADVLMIDGGSVNLPVGPEAIHRVADAAGQVARMTSDAGLTCTWHQHWNTLFQYPNEFGALMDATDADYLKCTLDTAQLALGGFDIPATFRRYADRMCYVHLKDLAADRRFADLGHGIVDFAQPAQVLIDSEFSGWVVNDLDYTDNDPFESSHRNLDYLKALLA